MGKTFQVDEVRELKQENGEPACGVCFVAEQQICIDIQYPQESQESTLLHEIIEAINGLTEMGLKHKQIATLETCLHQILRENKLHFDKAGD
jgi:hypothetical protein